MKAIIETLSENVNGGESEDSVEQKESDVDADTNALGPEPYRFEKKCQHIKKIILRVLT